MKNLSFDLRLVLRQLRNVSWICDNGGADAGPGHWGDHGDFLDCRRRFCCARCRFRILSRLMVLADRMEGAEVGGNGEAGVTVPDIRAYTRDTKSFTALGGYQFAGYELSGSGEAAQVSAARMTPRSIWRARGCAAAGPRLHGGRRRAQPAGGGAELRNVEEPLQRERANSGDQGLLDRKPYVVIGVMPRNFEFPLVPGQLNHSEFGFR